MNTSKISFLMLMRFAVLWIACRTRTPSSEIPEGPDPFDKRFLVWLINHHNDDDRMVGPCASKTDIRQELRDFCVNVDHQHRERVERMKGWLRDWYGSEYPRTDDIPLWLGGLQEQEFEREFLKEYIGHHADAVDPLSSVITSKAAKGYQLTRTERVARLLSSLELTYSGREQEPHPRMLAHGQRQHPLPSGAGILRPTASNLLLQFAGRRQPDRV